MAQDSLITFFYPTLVLFIAVASPGPASCLPQQLLTEFKLHFPCVWCGLVPVCPSRPLHSSAVELPKSNHQAFQWGSVPHKPSDTF